MSQEGRDMYLQACLEHLDHAHYSLTMALSCFVKWRRRGGRNALWGDLGHNLLVAAIWGVRDILEKYGGISIGGDEFGDAEEFPEKER